MSTAPADRASALREAFDRSFAEAPSSEREELVDLLALHAGGRPYAIVLDECAGLYRGRPVTPLPESAPGLLGLAGFRGVVVPVYDLSSLLGHADAGETRWLMLVGAGSVAIGFDEFEGYLRVPRGAISRAEHGAEQRLVRAGGTLRALIDSHAVLETIGRRAALARPQKET